ncbi:MAG: SLC45 family MFS transporter [Clostridia bacterium]|nr:SLC45 family MFS transporter [Clostridia bacterium]
MKLNYKRTVLIGLAFMSICMFWQMYDGVIPLMLKQTFHISDSIAGAIMAFDNVIALFLLPIFGAFSDKCNTKIGRRMPFIIAGTVIAVMLMTFIPIFDNHYAASPEKIYLVLFIFSLGILLIAMGIYRSPAVALMPDVTPKPLRSKANAIINLMGAIGGIVYLIIASILFSAKKTQGLSHVNYQSVFVIVSILMAVSVIVLFATTKEPKLVAELREYEALHPEDDGLIVDQKTGQQQMSKEVKKSLAFLLASIALWFTAYNAITTAFTKYAQQEWNMALGEASMCLTIAMAVAIVSYIPIGELSSKIGRKKSILIGVAMLAGNFLLGAVMTYVLSEFSPVLYVIFGGIGIAWATISVNSLPMVVEMCKDSDVGKFTGLYYTFSMSAQIITPILSGLLLEHVGYFTLFPYAVFFSAASFITMLMVKHGDNKPTLPKDRIELLGADD